MSAQTFLWLLFFSLVVAWFVIRGLWRAWAISCVRRAALAATPAVEELERTITSFYERFPSVEAERLPMGLADYPDARPRKKPSPPRARSRRPRSSYRRTRW